jgi:hypothetical protein
MRHYPKFATSPDLHRVYNFPLFYQLYGLSEKEIKIVEGVEKENREVVNKKSG